MPHNPSRPRGDCRRAVEAFGRRDPARVHIPRHKHGPGGRLHQREPAALPGRAFPRRIPAADRRHGGGPHPRRGGRGGLQHARMAQDSHHLALVRSLLAQDVLVVQTGCSAIACAKAGLLRPEAALEYAGPGLQEVCAAVGIPPVLHVGSCVDNSRILSVCVGAGGRGRHRRRSFGAAHCRGGARGHEREGHHHRALRGGVGNLHRVHAGRRAWPEAAWCASTWSRTSNGKPAGVPVYQRHEEAARKGILAHLDSRKALNLAPMMYQDGVRSNGPRPRLVHLRPAGRACIAGMRQGPGTQPVETSGGMTCARPGFPSRSLPGLPGCELACSVAHSGRERLEAAIAEALPPVTARHHGRRHRWHRSAALRAVPEPLCAFSLQERRAPPRPHHRLDRARRSRCVACFMCLMVCPTAYAPIRPGPRGALRRLPGPRDAGVRGGLSHRRADRGRRPTEPCAANSRGTWWWWAPPPPESPPASRPRARPGVLHHAGHRRRLAAILAAAALLRAGGPHRPPRKPTGAPRGYLEHELGVHVIGGRKAVRLDSIACPLGALLLDDGEELPFERLILATARGRPRLPSPARTSPASTRCAISKTSSDRKVLPAIRSCGRAATPWCWAAATSGCRPARLPGARPARHRGGGLAAPALADGGCRSRPPPGGSVPRARLDVRTGRDAVEDRGRRARGSACAWITAS
jgi:ferredoxin